VSRVRVGELSRHCRDFDSDRQADASAASALSDTQPLAQPQTSPKPSTPLRPTVSPPFLHNELPLSRRLRWPTSQDPFRFKGFSNLPYCGTRKRRASLYSNIPLPCNSKVATRSTILITLCRIKQRTSENVKGSPNR
jgi:hypothetical protein